jgi:HSP20 family molecular chaperone IbpA
MNRQLSQLLRGRKPRRVDFFSEVSRDLDEVFNQVFAPQFFVNGKGRGYPRLDAVREDGKLKLQYTVPGVKSDDLNVELTSDDEGQLLTVSGNLSSEYTHEENNYQIRELSSQEFRRVVRLPEDVEGEPEAELRDGILTLTFAVVEPEADPEPEVKKIEVKSAE